MARSKSPPSLPELREFIKEHHQRLYDYCAYMLPAGAALEDLVLAIFRDFGQEYRRLFDGKDLKTEAVEIRVRLFQIAGRHLSEAIGHLQPSWTVGRDTRPLKSFDDDLLVSWKAGKSDLKGLEPVALERLQRLDADFRAPLVLRDVLGFEDEEVVRILGIRWGVFRHRLHRGRLEYKDVLRGRPFTEKAKSTTVPPSPT